MRKFDAKTNHIFTMSQEPGDVLLGHDGLRRLGSSLTFTISYSHRHARYTLSVRLVQKPG
jgi:hypothetical protein